MREQAGLLHISVVSIREDQAIGWWCVVDFNTYPLCQVAVWRDNTLRDAKTLMCEGSQYQNLIKGGEDDYFVCTAVATAVATSSKE